MYINRFSYLIKKSATIKIQIWYKNIYKRTISLRTSSYIVNNVIDNVLNQTNPQESTIKILLDENDNLNNKYTMTKEENDILERMLIMSNSQNEELIDKVNNMKEEMRILKVHQYRRNNFNYNKNNQLCSLQ
jgi:predicted RNase H-like nuclease (RuvC/YqgF family)